MTAARRAARARRSPEELRALCAERLAGFKVPKAIVAVDALPRNAAGKLLCGGSLVVSTTRRCVERWAAAAAAAGSRPTTRGTATTLPVSSRHGRR